MVSDCEDSEEDLDEHLVVAIDAPKLQYMRLRDGRTASFVLDNMVSLVNADIDAVFNLIQEERFDPNDLQKRSMFRKFLAGISGVQSMIITSSTLEVIYDYSRCESLPLFKNLSFLRVGSFGYKREMLSMFLERCPNLKSLALVRIIY
ncbi:unnamed protein product [Thlaspi arvense]|uniref:Uncharacterized protein n=1 Tax=Thlaspi arvense TaxID=13288 RepID=A0AAU9SQD7_THLAR|nr:unnamed protein product [Thlaspi arvense]